MVKRVFWVALGATVGVLVVTKASKSLRRFTPSGIADGVPGALRGFLDDVHYAAAEREMELYRVLGVDVNEGPNDRR